MENITRRNFVGTLGAVAACAAAGALATAGAPQTGYADEATGEMTYEPGTYRAAAKGMAGYVGVAVTFDEHSIVDIQIEDENQTVGICEEVYEQVPASIIEAQSLAVDSVSGATITSYAVKEAVATCALMAGGDVEALRNAPVAVEAVDEAYDYDVVVVGAGLAGLCTAINAAREGAHVALVEKQGVMGTGIFSSGLTYIAQDESGIEPMFERWITNAPTTSEYPNQDRVRDLCEVSPELYQFLIDLGFEFTLGIYGDISPMASEGMLRNNIPIRLGSKEPLAKGGENLLRCLQAAAIDAGIDIYWNTEVTDFIMDGDKVAGVVSDTDRGVKTFNAASVVLCSGDYSRNPELVEQYCPEAVTDITSSASGNTGRCLELAVEAGAAVYEDQLPMSGVFAFEPDNKPVVGQPFNQFPYDCLLVDYNGYRQVREDAPNSHVQHQYFVDPERPGAGWAIMDRSIARKVWVMPELIAATEKGNGRIKAYKADTIEELAQFMEVDPTVLSDQLAAYNAACEAGVDEEFGKDVEYLVPMPEGPYYAVLSYSIIRAISGGVKTDRDFHVIREDGSPIAGLYATGIASSREYWGDFYPGAMAIALCTHGGFIAGRNAAMGV